MKLSKQQRKFLEESSTRVVNVRARSFGQVARTDTAFQEACRAGKSIEYHAADWVAMSRARYDELTKPKLKVYVDESEGL